VTTIAERFKESGYRTGAVISGAPLRRTYGLDRGFDHYDDQGLGIQGDNAITPSSRPAEVTTARALEWLGKQPRDARLFLWVHYYDPHEPYLPPSPFLDRYAGRPYAGEVAYVDAQLAPLLERARTDASRKWIVAVTGDHGEGLGDHGEKTHGILLYGSTTEVPLILWPARGPAAGAAPFSLVDVAPTLCELAGVRPPAGEGVSVFSGRPGDRWLAAETVYPALGYGLNPAFLLRRGSLVYLDHGSPEVYDLASDAGQTADFAASERGREFSRQALVEKERLLGADLDANERTLSLSRGESESLRSLGYVEGPRTARRALRKADLRRFAADLSRLDEARRLFSARRFPEALRSYDAFVGAYPDSAMAHQERGQVLAAMGDGAEAARAFGKALALDPADAISALDLGNLAAARGDYAAAESFFRRSIAIEEGQPEAHLNLALLYLHYLARPKDAKPHLERFLALAPDDPEAPKIRRLAAGL
jgi:tetratricopeptide (TPR) repeat protein